MVGSSLPSLETDGCGFGCTLSFKPSGRFARQPSGGARTVEQLLTYFDRS